MLYLVACERAFGGRSKVEGGGDVWYESSVKMILSEIDRLLC